MLIHYNSNELIIHPRKGTPRVDRAKSTQRTQKHSLTLHIETMPANTSGLLRPLPPHRHTPPQEMPADHRKRAEHSRINICGCVDAGCEVRFIDPDVEV